MPIRSARHETPTRSACRRSQGWAARFGYLIVGRPRRRAALALRAAVLGAFGVFFAVPLVWLVLAPTKTDDDLLRRSPLAVGNLENVRAAWRSLNAFGGHIFWRWM